MATAAFMVVNPTDSDVTNINAGGDDVPANAMLESSTLTDAEQATTLASGLLLLKVSGTSDEERRKAGKILRLGELPGSANS